MSAQFEPKNIRNYNKDSYDSLAYMFKDWTIDNLSFAKNALDRLKVLDVEWAKQGEP